jgi:RHS repeat-associated protein
MKNHASLPFRLGRAVRACVHALCAFAFFAAGAAYALPTVSVISPASGSSFTAPAAISLAANVTASSGKTITQVQFFRGGSTLIGTATRTSGTTTSGTWSFNWNSVAAASYSVTAKATDSTGTTTSSAVSLTVIANAAPTTSITSPAASSVFGSPANITLSANAADSDGTVTQVQFFRGGTTLIGTASLASGTASSGAWVFNWTGVANASYSLTSKATDNHGTVTTSSAVAITVHNNVLPTVSITAPADGSSFTDPPSIALTTSASDTDGGVTGVQFFGNGNLIGSATRTSGTPASGTWVYNWANPPAIGGYSITAKATDINGGVKTSTAKNIDIETNAPFVDLSNIDDATTMYVPSVPVTIPLIAHTGSPVGDVTQMQFFNGATLLGNGTLTDGNANNGAWTYNWADVGNGTYNITAKATNDSGLTGTSPVGALTVLADLPATVTLEAPGGNSYFADSSGTVPSIPLRITAADPDGTVARVDILINDAGGQETLVTINNPPAGVPVDIADWVNVLPNFGINHTGSYLATAVAYDNLGQSTTSASVNIGVGVNTGPASITLLQPSPINDGTAFVEAGPGGGSLAIVAEASIAPSTTPPLPAVSMQFYTSPAGGIQNQVATGAFTGADGSGLNGFWSATWNGIMPGNYTLYAGATDAQGVTAISNIGAHVVAIADSGAVVSITAPAGGNLFLRPGALSIPITFTSSPNPVSGSGASRVAFSVNGTPVGTATSIVNGSNNFIGTLPSPALGTYTLTAVATDNFGVSNTVAPVTFNVVPDPGASASMSSPAIGAAFTAGIAGVTVPLAATVTDNDDAVTQVNFYNGATLLGAGTLSSGSAAAGGTSTWGYNWTAVPAGSYSITAQAVNAANATGTSAPLTVNVAADSPPTITLNNPGSTFGPGSAITLTASAADDGAVTQVNFFFGSSIVATGTLSGGTAASGTWSGTWRDMSAGTYTLTAQATDDLGVTTTSAPVTVTITEPNSNPQAGMYFISADHLGTPRLVQNMQQQAVWTWNSDEPFGDSTPNENPNGAGPFTLNQRFPGQYADVETGASYNYARDYNPLLGRYLESDPIGLKSGPDTYLYVLASPLAKVDPYGLEGTTQKDKCVGRYAGCAASQYEDSGKIANWLRWQVCKRGEDAACKRFPPTCCDADRAYCLQGLSPDGADARTPEERQKVLKCVEEWGKCMYAGGKKK